LKSFYAKDTSGTDNKQGNRRDRDVHNQGAGGDAGATDCLELGAHGYEVEPRDIVDESGFVIAMFSQVRQPLSTCAALTLDLQMPSHILTVYGRSAPNKRFIAKKVREESNELEIFELLNTFQPKSEHIISLHESFQTQSTSWAVFPKMISLAHGQLYGKVSQVCWGLIKGVAYLHKVCIAHRDIKPENLVVDWDFCLTSMSLCEYRARMRWSKADAGRRVGWRPRWRRSRCIARSRPNGGQLDKFRAEDTVLRMTARKLTAHNPEQRSSMLQVAAALSDVVNVAVKRKALQSLPDCIFSLFYEISTGETASIELHNMINIRKTGYCKFRCLYLSLEASNCITPRTQHKRWRS
jgi:hypothetical protein